MFSLGRLVFHWDLNYRKSATASSIIRVRPFISYLNLMSFILTSYLSTIYAFFWDVLYYFWIHEGTVASTTEPYIVSTNSGIAVVEDIEGIVKEISLTVHDPLKSWLHSPACPQERWWIVQHH